MGDKEISLGKCIKLSLTTQYKQWKQWILGFTINSEETIYYDNTRGKKYEINLWLLFIGGEKMKIVNKREFMKLKTPILYSHYRPCVIEGLFVCEDNTSCGMNDFCETTLLDEQQPIGVTEDDMVGWSDGDRVDLLDRAEKQGEQFELDLDCGCREGLYDDTRLYVVYEPQDMKKLIDRLQGIYSEARLK